MRQAKWTADGQHCVANFNGILLRQAGHIQIGFVEGQHGDIGAGVRPEPLGLQFAAVVEPDGDVVEFGPVNHMAIGDDDRSAGHLGNHARASLVFARLAVAGTQRRLIGIDMHHRRPQQLREPPDLGALPLQVLGIFPNLLVEPVPVARRQAFPPRGIDTVASERIAALGLGARSGAQCGADRRQGGLLAARDTSPAETSQA